MRDFLSACNAVAGFGLLYLGAFLSVVASLIPETCIGGSADGLMIGAAYCLVLYLAGVVCLYFAKPRSVVYLALLPILPVAAWQILFTADLAHGYFVRGYGACVAMGWTGDTLDGHLDGPLDGREGLFIALWCGVNIVLLAGLVAVFNRSGR